MDHRVTGQRLAANTRTALPSPARPWGVSDGCLTAFLIEMKDARPEDWRDYYAACAADDEPRARAVVERAHKGGQ